MVSYVLDFLNHYLTLPVVFAALLGGCLCWLICRREEKLGKITRKEWAAFTALSVYLILVFLMLIFTRTIKNGRHFSLQLFWSYRAIAAGKRQLLYVDVLNVLLFVPFGLLCPMAERKPGFWKTAGFGAGLSLLIELAQGLTERGLFELDDLFHNIVGTALGAGLWLLFSRRRAEQAEIARKMAEDLSDSEGQ